MHEGVITSLAILKVNWDRGRDYVENFVPFVAECLRTAPQPEVSLLDLQGAVAEAFGLTVPQGALKTILKRAVKHGYVERAHGIYRRNEKRLATLDLAKTRASVLRRQEALIAKLVEFCKTQYEVNWSGEEAEVALLGYLKEHSMPILSAAVEGGSIAGPARPRGRAEFLIKTFIAHLCKSDPGGFEFLETVVKGSMLANVFFLLEVGAVSQRFARVEVYLDTPFLLRALGFEGPGMQEPCRELLDILYELDAAPRCFEHTVEEIRGVLDFAARALRDPRLLAEAYSDALWYFAQCNYQPSDVELRIARLERSLRGLRVQVKPRPCHEDRLGVDEVRLEAILQEEVRYKVGRKRRVDLDSLTAIHRLRRGMSPRHIESCSAVFVTTNTALARASARFFREQHPGMAAGVPACVLDHIFTTIVWLKKPLRAPDLPRKRIIADCYAGLNPPNSLWRLYLQEVDQLRSRGEVSEEDYHLLRLSMEARSLLMQATLGEEDAFTEGTVKEILEKSRAAVRAETEAALQAERKQRIAAERRAIAADARWEARRQLQLDRFRSVGARVGYWVSRAVLALVIALQLLGLFLTLPLPAPFPDLLRGWLRLVVPLLLAALGIVSMANLTFGTVLMSLGRRLEVRVSRFIEDALIHTTTP